MDVPAADPATSPAPRRPSWFAGWAGTAIRVVVTLGLMAVVLRGVDRESFLAIIRTVDWRWWATGLAIALVVQVIAGLRWSSLARPVGFTFPAGLFVWRFFEGMFFSLCLPSSIGGDVIKAYRLADSTPRRLLAGCTVLADRLTGLAGLGVLAGAAVIAVEWSLGPWGTIAAGGLLLAAVLGVTWLGVGSLDRVLALIPAAHPARQFVSQLLPYQMRPAILAGAVAWSLVIQFGNAVAVSVIARGLGVTLPLSVWCVVVPLVMLAMVVPISINGVGVREGGLAMLLAPRDVPGEQAVAIALLWFLSTIVSGLIGGLLFMLDRHPAAVAPSADIPADAAR
jgi:uncharacterized membrane protein YbhN (UPF0104 family)